MNSHVKSMMEERLQRDGLRLVSVKRQVNSRIELHHSVGLDLLSEALQMSRSALAAELLEAAIRDAGEVMGLNVGSVEFAEQYRDRINEVTEEELAAE